MYFQTKYFFTGNKQTLQIVIGTSVEVCRQNTVVPLTGKKGEIWPQQRTRTDMNS